MRKGEFIQELERIGLKSDLGEVIVTQMRDQPTSTTRSLGGLLVRNRLLLYREDISAGVTPYGFSGPQSFGKVLQETRILGLPAGQTLGDLGSSGEDISDVQPLLSDEIKRIEENFHYTTATPTSTEI